MMDFVHILLLTDLTAQNSNILILYQDPVHKNNIPVHLALLSGWVSLNTEIVVLRALNFYTNIMQSQKNQYSHKILAA